MELDALSRNDHVEDFRQNRVHAPRQFARERPTRRSTASARSARFTLPNVLGASVGDSIKSSDSAMVFARMRMAGPDGPGVTLG